MLLDASGLVGVHSLKEKRGSGNEETGTGVQTILWSVRSKKYMVRWMRSATSRIRRRGQGRLSWLRSRVAVGGRLLTG